MLCTSVRPARPSTVQRIATWHGMVPHGLVRCRGAWAGSWRATVGMRPATDCNGHHLSRPQTSGLRPLLCKHTIRCLVCARTRNANKHMCMCVCTHAHACVHACGHASVQACVPHTCTRARWHVFAQVCACTLEHGQAHARSRMCVDRVGQRAFQAELGECELDNVALLVTSHQCPAHQRPAHTCMQRCECAAHA